MTLQTEAGASTAEPGYLHQTFLVGAEIYLRRIEKGDANLTVSWRESVFPISPAVTETWIADELPKSRQALFAVVRKQDDRVVGSLTSESQGIFTHIESYIDPFYGSQAGAWKAEVFRLVLPWMVKEQARVSLCVTVGGDETAAIAALRETGAWEVARTPDLLNREGERVDLVRFQYLHPDWIARLGDPRREEIVRSGEPRPVPAKVVLEDGIDPPKNALLVGERVYLKPLEKEDAELMARLSRREPETDYGYGRRLSNQANKVARRIPELKERWPTDIGFSLCLRENDKVIGEVAIIDIRHMHGYGETASWIYDPEYRGDGYGSEAKHLLLEYAFDILGLRAVESTVLFQNHRSAAALRKQGYREVGAIYWTGVDGGSFHGNLVFHLTADTWRALPRTATTNEVSTT